MGTDYNEIICTAIDTIVSAKIQQLQYDITKVCQIEDDSMAAQGKYIVADGAAKYEAFTNDTALRKGNSVQVLIPNGDYNMQKTIVSRIAANDTTPYTYVSPMDAMLKITDNVFLGTPVTGILANEDSPNGENTISKSVMIHSVSNLQDLGGYTRLGVEADIRTWLPSDTSSGIYGIQLKITDQNGYSHKVQPFTNNEMYGNPYQFNHNFTQEMVYDISYIDSIKTIEAYLFEDGKFKNDKDEYIPWQEEFDGEVFKSSNNIFIDDLRLYFGYDKKELSDNFIQIYSLEGTLFGGINNESMQKNIQARWFQRNKNNDFDLMPSSMIQQDAYEIKWFKYTGSMNYNETGPDIYYPEAGDGWHLVQDYDVSKPFNYSFNIDSNTKTISYKAICYEYFDYATTEDGKKSSNNFSSNTLVFTNRSEVADQTTITANNALTLNCLDNSDGNYFLYNSLGQIIRSELGKSATRYLQASFSKQFLSGYKKLTGVKWILPSKENTMLDFDWIEENNGQFRIDGKDITGTLTGDNFTLNLPNDNSVEIDFVNDKTAFLSYLKLPYSIKGQQLYNLTDNSINCEIELDGTTFYSIKQFIFGRIASDTYGLSLSLNFEDNATGLIAETGRRIKVKANLYRFGNEELFSFETTGSNYEDTIDWKWFKQSDSPLIKMQEGLTKEMSTISIGYHENSNAKIEEHCSILQATFKRNFYNGTPYQIVAYLPIPLKKNENYINLDGATEIIYEKDGKPTYTPIAYNLTKGNTSDTFKYEIYYKEQREDFLKYLPKLKYGMDGAFQALKATNLNIKIDEDRMSVIVRNEQTEEIVWVQPILIQQNQISESTEQNWDSDVLIGADIKITNTSLGRGSVDLEGKVSGIFIGDKREDNDSLNTGIYGAKNNEVSYYLNELGEFYFKSDKITIDPRGNDKILKFNDGAYFDADGKFQGEAAKATNADFASTTAKLQGKINGKEYEYDVSTILDLYEQINQLQENKIKVLEAEIEDLIKRLNALEQA